MVVIPLSLLIFSGLRLVPVFPHNIILAVLVVVKSLFRKK